MIVQEGMPESPEIRHCFRFRRLDHLLACMKLPRSRDGPTLTSGFGDLRRTMCARSPAWSALHRPPCGPRTLAGTTRRSTHRAHPRRESRRGRACGARDGTRRDRRRQSAVSAGAKKAPAPFGTCAAAPAVIRTAPRRCASNNICRIYDG